MCADLRPGGNDALTGRTHWEAWRSVDRVNRHFASPNLAPGDRIQFQAGHRFIGQLVIDARPGGTIEHPLVITSFGPGRATLTPTTEHGLLVRETPWVTVSNLVFHAGPGNRTDGLRLIAPATLVREFGASALMGAASKASVIRES